MRMFNTQLHKEEEFNCKQKLKQGAQLSTKNRTDSHLYREVIFCIIIQSPYFTQPFNTLDHILFIFFTESTRVEIAS